MLIILNKKQLITQLMLLIVIFTKQLSSLYNYFSLILIVWYLHLSCLLFETETVNNTTNAINSDCVR